MDLTSHIRNILVPPVRSFAVQTWTTIIRT